MVNPPDKVLVVDDDDIIRRLIERMLTISGHTVLSAASGREALALLAAHPVDLAIIDLMMPEMSGAEVLQQIKASPDLCDLPVIVVSADTDSDNIATCLRLGADDYLTKPFNTIFFNARVAASLARRQRQAQEQAYRRELEAQIGAQAAALAHAEALLRRQTAIVQAILACAGAGGVVVDSADRNEG